MAQGIKEGIVFELPKMCGKLLQKEGTA